MSVSSCFTCKECDVKSHGNSFIYGTISIKAKFEFLRYIKNADKHVLAIYNREVQVCMKCCTFSSYKYTHCCMQIYIFYRIQQILQKFLSKWISTIGSHLIPPSFSLLVPCTLDSITGVYDIYCLIFTSSVTPANLLIVSMAIYYSAADYFLHTQHIWTDQCNDQVVRPNPDLHMQFK